MKKKVLFFIHFLLIHLHPMEAYMSTDECVLWGIGIITTLSGVRLLHKATKKKGTKKQTLGGFLLTASGIAILLFGPRKVRMIHEENNKKFSWSSFSRKNRRQLILNSLQGQLEEEQCASEPSMLSLLRLHCLHKIIEYDPLNFVVDNISWRTVIKEGIKEGVRNLSPRNSPLLRRNA